MEAKYAVLIWDASGFWQAEREFRSWEGATSRTDELMAEGPTDVQWMEVGPHPETGGYVLPHAAPDGAPIEVGGPRGTCDVCGAGPGLDHFDGCQG